MQVIHATLKIGSSGVTLCDEYGSGNGKVPEIMLGTGCVLKFALRGEPSGESAVLPDYHAAGLGASVYYCAFDFSCSNNASPALLVTEGTVLEYDTDGHPFLSVTISNTASDSILEKLKERESMELFCELGGLNASGESVFAWQFKASFRSRVYWGGGGDTAVSPPEYYTALQVDAMLAGLEDKIDSADLPASEIVITDERGFFETENVESVLQEIGIQLDGLNELLKEI